MNKEQKCRKIIIPARLLDRFSKFLIINNILKYEILEPMFNHDDYDKKSYRISFLWGRNGHGHGHVSKSWETL